MDHQAVGGSSDTSEELQLETIPCPLCNCERFRILLKGVDRCHHIGGTFQIVRCADCGHAYLNPRPVFSDIMKCYPSDYGPYHAESHQPGETSETNPEPPAKSPWYLKKWVRAIPGPRALYYWLTADRTTYIPEISSEKKRALELGCSTGGFLQKIQAEGWEATGVELAEEPAQVARQRGFPVHTGTLESANFGSESFEAVFLYMVLEHLHDPRGTLQEIHRILVPGGWLVFTVPNFACWETYVIRDYSLELPRHLQHFTPRILKSLLAETDFQDIQILHQRNLNNIVVGLGLWLCQKTPFSGIGQRLVDFTNNPTLVGTLLLAPFAKLAAFVRQGGRLTVIARKPNLLPAPVRIDDEL